MSYAVIEFRAIPNSAQKSNHIVANAVGVKGLKTLTEQYAPQLKQSASYQIMSMHPRKLLSTTEVQKILKDNGY